MFQQEDVVNGDLLVPHELVTDLLGAHYLSSGLTYSIYILNLFPPLEDGRHIYTAGGQCEQVMWADPVGGSECL